jgi:hypothetical protein
MSDSYDSADAAFAALTELFSKPIKNEKRHRRYDLTFVNGEPVFTQNEIDRMFDEIVAELYGSSSEE